MRLVVLLVAGLAIGCASPSQDRLAGSTTILEAQQMSKGVPGVRVDVDATIEGRVPDGSPVPRYEANDHRGNPFVAQSALPLEAGKHYLLRGYLPDSNTASTKAPNFNVVAINPSSPFPWGGALLTLFGALLLAAIVLVWSWGRIRRNRPEHERGVESDLSHSAKGLVTKIIPASDRTMMATGNRLTSGAVQVTVASLIVDGGGPDLKGRVFELYFEPDTEGEWVLGSKTHTDVEYCIVGREQGHVTIAHKHLSRPHFSIIRTVDKQHWIFAHPDVTNDTILIRENSDEIVVNRDSSVQIRNQDNLKVGDLLLKVRLP